MRFSPLLIPLVILSACATPREQCIDAATRDSRVISSLIAETRGNLERGYALEEEQELRTLRRRCRGVDEDGDEFSYRCDRTITVSRTVPVAIDLNAEQAKLSSLEERFTTTQAASNQAVAQCIAIHPE